jgi:hypothetical protein
METLACAPTRVAQKQNPAEAGLCRHNGQLAIADQGGQQKLDLIAGATGDTAYMCTIRLKVNSQSKARSDTFAHSFHGFLVQNTNIVNALAAVPPGKQQL